MSFMSRSWHLTHEYVGDFLHYEIDYVPHTFLHFKRVILASKVLADAKLLGH